MPSPNISDYFNSRTPSVIRLAQIEFMKRTDSVRAVNVSIGSVSLPMHPAMQKRMRELGAPGSPHKDGVVKYSATVGSEETRQAFLNIIASSNFATGDLQVLVTDGGSQAMEVVIAGTCGFIHGTERPLLLIDAAYTNYHLMAKRLRIPTISITRTFQADGSFTLPDLAEIERVIQADNPGAIVVIPYDNPTGQFYPRETMLKFAALAVKYNLWLISDEAYRELNYSGQPMSSVWGLSDQDVKGITGRRLSIESSSKVWNACGLRVGAVISDNRDFFDRCVAEYTANLCSNVIGQYIFGSLAHESHADLQQWYGRQRTYYKKLMHDLTDELKQLLPGIIVSNPDAAIYSVIDVRAIAKPGFDANEFVRYCATNGSVRIGTIDYTLLLAPMDGFYSVAVGRPNPGKTQMRIAYVETPDKMKLVPGLFVQLFKYFEAARKG